MAARQSLNALRERVALPFREPLMEADVVFLKKALTTQNGSGAAGEFYYLALRKLLKSVSGDLTEARRREYLSQAPVYAALLANAISPGSFDAVVCVPTSSVEMQTPYLEALMLNSPSATDLSSKIHRPEGSSSTSGKTWSERREQIEFEATDSGSPSRILVIDDVLHTGDNSSLVMDVISCRLNPRELHFTLLCPLWMV